MGKASVELSFAKWDAVKVSPTHFAVDVVAPPKPATYEPISSRLKATLIHSNPTGYLYGLKWSPDGRRILAGDYPGGTVQVWDVATGQSLVKIDTGTQKRYGWEFFPVAPDFSRLYVSNEGKRNSRIKKDGQEFFRWEFAGKFRTWDLNDGRLVDTFQHSPPHNVGAMMLSPNGRWIVANEQRPGDYPRAAPYVGYVWDLQTKAARPLPENVIADVRFAPDGHSFVTTQLDKAFRQCAVKVFDTASLREKLTIPLTEPLASLAPPVFSPDAKLLVAYIAISGTDGRAQEQSSLKFWDAQTGQELASIATGKVPAAWPVFSPDGRYLAAVSARSDSSQVHIIDLRQRSLVKSITLREPGFSVVQPAAFSPDSKWLAVPCSVSSGVNSPTPEEMPQPFIHLIDVATTSVRETIAAPPAWLQRVAFSPDGKTLASEGYGRVHLWDMTREPGSAK